MVLNKGFPAPQRCALKCIAQCGSGIIAPLTDRFDRTFVHTSPADSLSKPIIRMRGVTRQATLTHADPKRLIRDAAKRQAYVPIGQAAAEMPYNCADEQNPNC